MEMNNIFEEYIFDTEVEDKKSDKLYILIIYDIIENKKRVKLAKFLQGYGFRIQKSAFEAMLTRKQYEKLLKNIGGFASSEDTIRVYRISGKGQVTCFGMKEEEPEGDVIII